jgi:hypothetical protein
MVHSAPASYSFSAITGARPHNSASRAVWLLPQTSSGHCYKPGEFCPHADAGMSGVAGDGAAIICEDNNGLRWEPA